MMRAPAALLLAGALLAGCTVGPPTNFYTLLPADAGAAGTPGAGPAFGLGPVELPAYLDRAEIVSRSGEHQVRLGEFDKWAEPLQPMFVDLLGQRLRAATGSRDVVPLPARDEREPPYAVAVSVERFDVDQTGKVVLDGRWRLYQTDDNRTLQSAHETVEVPGAAPPDYASVVAAMSRAVDGLAQKIAPALARLAPKARPARS